MKQEKNQYRLIIQVEGQSPLKIDVVDSISVGTDPRNDLVLINKKINHRHLLFELKGENLALVYLGLTNQTFLNHLPLDEGRTYLLDVNDIINFSGVEINITQELMNVHETQKLKRKIFDESPPLLPSEIKVLAKKADPPLFEREPLPPITENVTRPTDKKNDVNFIYLWMIKIYSMVGDFFFTYLFLITIPPLLTFQLFTSNMIQFAAAAVIPTKATAFYSFVLFWFILSFVQTLIFGTTISQFLLGLHYKETQSFWRMIFNRIKTVAYSLLLLPAQNSYKKSLPYKAMRKAGIIIIMIFIIATPYFLPAPFNNEITLISKEDIIPKELHTRSIKSFSKDLGMSLEAELSYRYFILPKIKGKSSLRAFEFFDLRTSESIVVEEQADFYYDELQKLLEYGNPFYDFFQREPLGNLSVKEKKTLIKGLLLQTPLKFKDPLITLGPFMGSGVLVKSHLLDNISTSDLVLKIYRPETPIMYVGSAQQDFFFLFQGDHLSRYKVSGKVKSNLVSVFEQEVFSKLVIDSESPVSVSGQKLSILSVQDAFLHGHEESILTYYVEIANSLTTTKIIHGEMDFTEVAKLAVVSNIKSNQKFITSPIVHRSLNGIINQLTPMEKPGEKR